MRGTRGRGDAYTTPHMAVAPVSSTLALAIRGTSNRRAIQPPIALQNNVTPS